VSLFLPFAFAFRRSTFYRLIALKWGSLLIAVVASLWLLERSSIGSSFPSDPPSPPRGPPSSLLFAALRLCAFGSFALNFFLFFVPWTTAVLCRFPLANHRVEEAPAIRNSQNPY